VTRKLRTIKDKETIIDLKFYEEDVLYKYTALKEYEILKERQARHPTEIYIYIFIYLFVCVCVCTQTTNTGK
jgi:hypothetical protein